MTLSEKRYIDLHVHSNCSDGVFSASELIELALRESISTIAIADHDSMANVSDGIDAANLTGIENIPSVELSTQYQSHHDVHLLGYGLDHTNSVFLKKLGDLQKCREQRIREMLIRVNENLVWQGLEKIDPAQVEAYAKGSAGRRHIARALLDKGYVKTVEEAFRRYLTPCNVPKRYWRMDDALSEIRRTGGIAVLAHPTRISSDRKELRRIIAELARIGLDGLEVYNNQATPDDMSFLNRCAEEFGLLVTGGSDFHGIEPGGVMGRGRNGMRFNADLLRPFRERLFVRRAENDAKGTISLTE